MCVRLGSWAQKILAIITSRFPKEKKPLGWLNAAWYSLGGFRGKCRKKGQIKALVLLVLLPAPPLPLPGGRARGPPLQPLLDLRTRIPDSKMTTAPGILDLCLASLLKRISPCRFPMWVSQR